MTRKSQLKSVSEVIDAFGGPKAMCAIFPGVPSRLSNYKRTGKFPKHMHMEIYVAACERGLNIAPELIGMKPPARQAELRLQAAEQGGWMRESSGSTERAIAAFVIG